MAARVKIQEGKGGPAISDRYPAQRSTGNGGYFGNRGSTFDNSHIKNREPRRFSMMRAFTQVPHKPGSAMPRGHTDHPNLPLGMPAAMRKEW
jgi:hypothetical protein